MNNDGRRVLTASWYLPLRHIKSSLLPIDRRVYVFGARSNSKSEWKR